ncbi:RHS repeat-associated core domain-containing protein [uncultured Microscilla sp.]|uniref:RHS repeat-associated core domain-containing protein n=1 Tax=uncultured Microscilla sp. TaxID=432653 RepID=UPI0026035FEC|nr:RHS repeat-associated core domain-containing protein [uncultured Microscilla sp.]
MKVTKGDKVSTGVYARISGAPSHPTASSLSLLVGTLAQAYNNNSETATNNPNVLQVGVSFTPGNAGSQSSGLPNAYLRYVFYDETGTRAIQSGKVFVTSVAHTAWERLRFDYEMPANGILQIYTANETDRQNVWFDDLKVDFTPQLIVQENHYYPFGMGLSGIEKVGKPNHKYLYNGKEKQEAFGLNWLSYGQREYDPAIGRFNRVDRFAENYYGFSSYQYGANDPIKHIDVNGGSLWINYGSKKLLYLDGKLFTKKGKDVTHRAYNKKGKFKRNSLGRVLGALSYISDVKEGKDMLLKLQSSKFSFTIQESKDNRFIPVKSKLNNASAIMNLDPENKHPFQKGDLWISGLPFDEIGSGGTVYWNPSYKFNSQNSALSLSHELFHAVDASEGLLDRRFVFGMKGKRMGEEVIEVRAVYNTNLIRKKKGLPLRKFYGDPKVPLVKNGSPINLNIRITNKMIQRFNKIKK